ncbi:MAG: hypothetical protein WC508_02090 [Patescibacteria group bacterium]
MKMVLVDLPSVSPKVLAARIQPPLWAAYLAIYLNQKVETVFVDGRLGNNAQWLNDLAGPEWGVWGIPLAELVDKLLSHNPDIIGIHVGVSADVGIACRLIKQLRAKFKGRIILGGSGVATIESKYLPLEISQEEVCWVRGIGSPLKLDISTPTVDINCLPQRSIFSEYWQQYIDWDRSHSGPSLVKPSAQIHTATGCGGHCRFCATNTPLRRKTLDSIRQELSELQQDYGVVGIQDESDNVLGFSDQQVTQAIPYLDLLIKMNFCSFESPNGLTVKGMLNSRFQAWLTQALEAGMAIRLLLPFESASDHILKAMQKPHRRKDCDRLIEQLAPLRDKGKLHLEVFLQVAFHLVKNGEIQLENQESITATLQWSDELKKVAAMNTWFNIPIPGTPAFPVWREKLPKAPWESLIFSSPSLLYPPATREELLKEIVSRNTATRSAAFEPLP